MVKDATRSVGGLGVFARSGVAVVLGLAIFHKGPHAIDAVMAAFSGPPVTWRDVIARADVTETELLMMRDPADVQPHAPAPSLDAARVLRAQLIQRVAEKELRLQALRVANGIAAPVSAGELGVAEVVLPDNHARTVDRVQAALENAIASDPEDAGLLTALRNARRTRRMSDELMRDVASQVPAPAEDEVVGPAHRTTPGP